MKMTCYSLAYHYKGEQKLADVKRVDVFASSHELAKEQFLKVEPNAILIDEMAYDLRSVLK